MPNRKYLCHFCGSLLTHTVVDLGMSPLCESFVPVEMLDEMEPFYPLNVKVCETCNLMQLGEYVSPENIFTEYAYYSSFSKSWLKHAADYTDMIVDRFELGANHFVVELASNDGYLLRNFVEKGIPCLGVEPSENVAQAADKVGVHSLVEFFSADTARLMVADGQQADLIIGNNVLAQIPDLNGFVEGVKILLKPQGVATFEFPHLKCLIDECQYDTIYHEHFCYFSWLVSERIFAAHGLRLFDVEELSTHGGSIRIYACHDHDDGMSITQRAEELRERELAEGYNNMAVYDGFGEKVKESKRALLSFLIQARREGKSVVGYGAPGKGNTLLNYCGIREDFIDFTVDRNSHKHGKFLPGTHIPVCPVEKIDEARPDYVLILPWNLKQEIMVQMDRIRAWGGKFVIPIPTTTVID